MKNKLIYIFALLWLMIPGTVSAQDSVRVIDLETILELGRANNLTVQEYKLKQDLILADLTKAKSWWLPDFYAGTRIHQLNGNVMNSDGQIFQGINRQNFWAGFGLNATWDFAEGVFTTNAIELKAEAAEYITETQKNKTLLLIIETYYDLLSAQLSANAYEKLNYQAQDIIRQIKIQVDAGLRYESEWLLSKSNLFQLSTDNSNALLDFYMQSAKLVQLLNLDPNIVLISQDKLLAPINFVTLESGKLPLEAAYDTRPELKNLNLLMDATVTEKKIVTTGLLVPELRIGTDGAIFGDVFSPIDPTTQVNASLMWKIPLDQIIYGGNTKQFEAKLAIQQNEIEQYKAKINSEILSLTMQINMSEKQIQLGEEASDWAKKALDQSIERQKLGTAKPLEIIQAQEMYIKSVLNYLTAVANYNKAQYRYFVAIGGSL